MKIIAVYPGRFQPFHKGHGQVYKWLKNKFGNATIATSNKVEAPKSPFTFEEKKKMMELAGVPASDITEVRNPYLAPEILRKYDGSRTVLVFAVSQKDMEEDPRFSFKPTKSGKPGYLQPFPSNPKDLQPFGDPEKPRGYVIVTPTFQFEVLGEPMKSATELRKQFASADNETQKKIIKDLFGRYDASVHKLMDQKIKGAMASAPKPKTIKQLKEELNHEKFGPMLDSFTDFASDQLGIKERPSMKLEKDIGATSFGGYNPKEKSIVVISKNRHPMDIFRTVAHELVHHKQNEDGKLGKDIEKEGATGSEIENEANSEAGKIMRWFAKKNPELFKSGFVVEETQIDEGIQDPSRLKAVFLAGGPGSGKDFVMNKTLQGHGLRELNSDTAFEHLMKKRGLSLKMPAKEKVQRELTRGRAKELSNEKKRTSMIGRQGLIINGTADDPEKISKMKQSLEDQGYKTMMVFVNTSNEVSKDRNIGRGKSGGREVPEEIRQEKWNKAQEAKSHLKKLFGDEHFIHVDNSDDYRKVTPERKQQIDDLHNMIYKHVKKFTSTPHETESSKSWEQQEKAKRGITKTVETRASKMSTRPNKPMPEYTPSASELEQAKRLGVQHIGGGQFGSKKMPTHVSKNGQLIAQKITEDLRKWFDPNHPEGGWKRINSKGEAIGPCAREPGEAKPKCMSNEKRAKLSKKERASAVAAKRRHDPNPERKGEPINVSNFGKGKLTKEQNMKYLQEKNVPTNPQLWSRAKALAKQKFDVYPSAYANGWASKWYKSKGGGWKSSVDENFETFLEQNNKPSDREWGTDSLTRIYKENTPGQTTPVNPLSEKKKKLRKEDNAPALGYEFGQNGIGPTFGVVRSPNGLGTGYSLPLSSMAESVQKWITNPKTIARYEARYGELAEQKLYETAYNLNQIKDFGAGEKKSFYKLREAWEAKGGRDMGTVANASSKEELPEETPAWQRKEGKSESGGLNRKGIASYRRENPGSKLSMAVTTKPSKLKKGSKAAKRRKSFCARMGGMPGPMKDEKGRPTRKALSLRKWNCEE